MNRRRMLRVASATLVALGAGHLTLSVFLTRDTLLRWAADGVWAAVPLLGSSTLGGARNALGFWAGLGSFAVPLTTLGLLIWHLAGSDTRLPAFVGWIVTAWCAVCALILVPSPFIVGAGAGVLLVIGSRRA